MLRRRLLWLVLPVVALAELGAHYYFSQRAPTAGQWRDLPAAVDAVRRPGDLLVVAPQWAEPLARQVLGEQRMPLADLGRMDATSYAGALEVGLLGEHAPEVGHFTQVAIERSGPFLIRRLRNPAPLHALYRFLANARAPLLQVTELRDGSELPCRYTQQGRSSAGGLGGHVTYPRERFRCSGGERFLVGVTVMDDQHYRPRRCLFAQPPDEGVLRLEFADVPFGRRIRGAAGFTHLLARDEHGAAVELGLYVAGRSVAAQAFEPHRGFQPFEFALPASLPARGPVRFEVRSASLPARELCFSAEML